MNGNTLPSFSTLKMTKPFYKNGRLRLVLKLSLPSSSSDNARFDNGFNAFYKAVEDSVISGAERSPLLELDSPRPVFAEFDWEQKNAPVGVVSILRQWKIRFSDGKSNHGETTDSFDIKSGFLIKEKPAKRK